MDRRAEVAAISDDEILRYIRQDNYLGLRPRLEARGWTGYLPDLDGYERGAGAFDERGFALGGSGWVAFNYKPQPATFWPTNGSTDDVLIRHLKPFRTTSNGAASADAYMAKPGTARDRVPGSRRDPVPPIHETAVQVDLDGDGVLSVTSRVQRRNNYVGDAGERRVNRMRYPRGTEFLHSVCYVGAEDGCIVVPKRMKELRCMRNTVDTTLAMLRTQYDKAWPGA